MNVQSPRATPDGGAATALNPRTARLLYGAIIPTLLQLAWPNMLVMLAQSSTSLIETWWLSRLGVDALAGMALVFPVLLMMTMLSAGALGGAIASAVARALGAGRHEEAEALAFHGLLLNVALGLATAAPFLLMGRWIYGAMGGTGASLDAAIAYSNVVFAGNVLLWVMNAFASIVRGTGNLLTPSVAICVGVVALVPLSPLLIFGLGPIPALGVAGGGLAVVLSTALMFAILGWYVLSGRSTVALRWTRLRWDLAREILRVGTIGTVNTLNTTLIMVLLTSAVGAAAGPDAIAGFGTAARLEFLLIPLVFGLGAPLVAMVGANVGAGQQERALRIAFTGAFMAFVLTGTIGVAASLWPRQWLLLFGNDPAMLASGTLYLQVVGPAYGFFGFGLTLYFASQGAGRLEWPLLVGLMRAALAVGGAWVGMLLSGSLLAIFAAIAVSLVAYGAVMTATVAGAAWARRVPATS
ncbi:MAG: MATE family efflux transporter [Rhodospirillales bacterium 69-11]|nr:MATE family efflux transporter [Rhodospirillales bacterium]MBN8926164.1 MATE family efflux transporter [Rhodospirillales bacterium]OJW18990.1 MAG: MATE family efflux transporter [Rhodospirillales bacterium 69-11]